MAWCSQPKVQAINTSSLLWSITNSIELLRIRQASNSEGRLYLGGSAVSCTRTHSAWWCKATQEVATSGASFVH
eukprot:1350440-Amphidinium_carterae.1